MWKKIALLLVLAFFLFLNYLALNDFGYMGVIEWFGANSATVLLSWDLIISLTLICIWIVQDARSSGRHYLLYLLVTLFFGVAGPLLYLIVREFSPQARSSTGTEILGTQRT